MQRRMHRHQTVHASTAPPVAVLRASLRCVLRVRRRATSTAPCPSRRAGRPPFRALSDAGLRRAARLADLVLAIAQAGAVGPLGFRESGAAEAAGGRAGT